MKIKWIALVALAVVTFASSDSLFAQSYEYTITLIQPPPGGFNFAARDINNLGEVVGWGSIPNPAGGFTNRAWHWSAGTGLTVLPAPPGQNNYLGVDISDTGIIAIDGAPGDAWVYDSGTYTPIPNLAGFFFTSVHGVNASGDVACGAQGSSSNPNEAFLYSGGTTLSFGAGDARGINDAGQVTGGSAIANGSRAFRGSSATGVELLPLAPGMLISFGKAINNSGAVAGWTANNTTIPISLSPFIYRDGIGTQLFPDPVNPPFVSGFRVTGLNDFGVVVAYTEPGSGADQPWMWDEVNGSRLLIPITQPMPGVNLLNAWDVNNLGQILVGVYDSNQGAFLPAVLMPTTPVPQVPEPTSLVCAEVNQDVSLSWSNGATYDEIRVHRDGSLLSTLPGATTTYVDSGLQNGSYLYEVTGVEGPIESAPAECVLLVVGSDSEFVRGDGNGDGDQNIADAIFVLFYLFNGGVAPECIDAADSNDDESLNIADALFLLGYLFNANAQPLPAPFPSCGPDPTGVALDCSNSACP